MPRRRLRPWLRWGARDGSDRETSGHCRCRHCSWDCPLRVRLPLPEPARGDGETAPPAAGAAAARPHTAGARRGRAPPPPLAPPVQARRQPSPALCSRRRVRARPRASCPLVSPPTMPASFSVRALDGDGSSGRRDSARPRRAVAGLTEGARLSRSALCGPHPPPPRASRARALWRPPSDARVPRRALLPLRPLSPRTARQRARLEKERPRRIAHICLFVCCRGRREPRRAGERMCGARMRTRGGEGEGGGDFNRASSASAPASAPRPCSFRTRCFGARIGRGIVDREPRGARLEDTIGRNGRAPAFYYCRAGSARGAASGGRGGRARAPAAGGAVEPAPGSG